MARRSTTYLLYTSLLVHDSNDVIASSGKTIFFDHTINTATKELNPVKEGYLLVAILVPFNPLGNGIKATPSSCSKAIYKPSTILLGYRFKAKKNESVQFLTGMTGSTYISQDTDANLCAVSYSVKRLRMCNMDAKQLGTVFGNDFVARAAALVRGWPLLEPLKAQADKRPGIQHNTTVRAFLFEGAFLLEGAFLFEG